MITIIGFLIVGLVIGWIIAWLIVYPRAKSAEAVNNELRRQMQQKESDISELRNELNKERQERVKARTELDASLKNLEEQKSLLETMKTEMTDTFNALSSAALKSSSEDFLRLASEHLGKIVAETKAPVRQ